MKIGLLYALTIVVITVGCSARKAPNQETRPSVGTSQIEHFQLPTSNSNQVGKPAPLVIPPSPVVQALPTYPESAIGETVACVAKILYHVEMSGQATLVRMDWEEPPPIEHLVEFDEAIRRAVSEWEFEPAIRIVPEIQDDGSIEPVVTPLPKALHAFIRFRVENGTPIVE